MNNETTRLTVEDIEAIAADDREAPSEDELLLRIAGERDESRQLAIELRDLAKGLLTHRRLGYCPGDPESFADDRDPNCNACSVLVRADALSRQKVSS